MTHNPQPHASRTPDARIDQILHALGATQPIPGLEARIHDRLAQARTAQVLERPSTETSSVACLSIFAIISNAISGHRSAFAPAIRYALTAASIAAVVTASIFALYHHPQAPAQTAASVDQPQLPTQISGSLEGAELQSAPIPTSSSATLAAATPHRNRQTITLATVAGSNLQSRRQPHLQNTAFATESPTDPDAIALAETLAPSRPAPPMPLTEQERLLVAVVRSGNQQEMAELDPIRREALFRQDQKAFQDFFTPHTPATQTGDTE